MLSQVFEDLFSRSFGLPSDPRTRNFFLANNPAALFSLGIFYVYFVKIWGPNWMKNRQPFKLKNVVMVYNAIMVIGNFYFLWSFLRNTYFGGGYSFFCQGISYATDEKTMRILNLVWWVSVVKLAELLDTVFFVLHKKFSHISTLHVIHHGITVFNVWVFARFAPEGQLLFFLMLNLLIHVIMYSYYFLACLGPRVQKYLWWKKYLTQFQILQFVVSIFHGAVPAVVDCGYPFSVLCLAFCEGLMFLALFSNFYYQAYMKGSNEFKTVCSVQKGGDLLNGKES